MRLRPTGWWLLVAQYRNGKEGYLRKYQSLDMADKARAGLYQEMKEGKRPDLVALRIIREYKTPVDEAHPQ